MCNPQFCSLFWLITSSSFRRTVVDVKVLIPTVIKGHGRLLDPPGRSSLWRYDSRAQPNYEDHELNCGGYRNHWENQQGKCGVCGDPFQGPLDNVPPGGKYAAGIISRDFDEGDIIISKVQVTADHKGYFEFKLCANNDVSRPVEQDCLDKTVLRILNATAEEPTRYYTHWEDWKTYELHLKLPYGVFGSQCVLQWRYHTGNSWGCDDDDCCIGCGEKQEEFYACADILIRPRLSMPTSSSPTTSQHVPPAERVCTANDQWRAVAGMNDWCKVNCVRSDTCPESHCECTGTDPSSDSHDSPGDQHDCIAAGLWSGKARMDDWCKSNCQLGHCPDYMCTCQ